MRFTFIILLLASFSIHAQNPIFKDLCKEYEMRTTSILDTENNHELVQQLAYLTLDLRKKYKSVETDFKTTFKAENYGLNDQDAELEFIQQMTLSIITYTNNILTINRRLSGVCPEETATLKLIKQDIDKLLAENSNLSLYEQKQLADNNYLNIMKAHQQQVNKDYDQGNFDPKLVNNLGNYLIHKSDTYCRAYLYASTIHSFVQTNDEIIKAF